MPYASIEKKRERKREYYAENKEELKRKRREYYQLQKNNWVVMVKEMPIGLVM